MDYGKKHIRVYHEPGQLSMANQIFCVLSALRPARIQLIKLAPNTTLEGLCNDKDFQSYLSVLNFTVTVTRSTQLEEYCIRKASVLHVKLIDDKWIGHILSPRTDLIVPLTKDPIDTSVLLLLETLMMAWGFDRSSADKNKYKSLKAVVDTVAQKKTIVPAVIVAMVVCIAFVGLLTFIAYRKKYRADQRAIRKRRSELLADWGQMIELSEMYGESINLEEYELEFEQVIIKTDAFHMTVGTGVRLKTGGLRNAGMNHVLV
ncbi:hypothetical protein Q1695_012672 [Nippostrongylus brasiliensis]|nr:hypothetical protein Q1695_012672 [Nippostrongylus brasiliensis]